MYLLGTLLFFQYLNSVFSRPGVTNYTSSNNQKPTDVWVTNSSPYASIGVPITWQQQQQSDVHNLWVPISHPGEYLTIYQTPGFQANPQANFQNVYGYKTSPKVKSQKIQKTTNARRKIKKTKKNSKKSAVKKNNLPVFEIPYAPGVKEAMLKRKQENVLKYQGVVQQKPYQSPIYRVPVQLAPVGKYPQTVKKSTKNRKSVKKSSKSKIQASNLKTGNKRTSGSKVESSSLQRQIQQWQIAVVGSQYPATGYPQQPQPQPQPQQPQTGYPPQGPGTVWIQVPAPQPGYPQQPGQPQPGYPQQPGQPQPGYPQQPGQPQPGYPQQPGQPQPGYPSQPGQPQPGYPQQPGQPQPGYPQQPGQPQPGYPQQPGKPQPGYPQQPGQPQLPGQPQPGYPQQPGQPELGELQPGQPQQPEQPLNPNQPQPIPEPEEEEEEEGEDEDEDQDEEEPELESGAETDSEEQPQGIGETDEEEGEEDNSEISEEISEENSSGISEEFTGPDLAGGENLGGGQEIDNTFNPGNEDGASTENEIASSQNPDANELRKMCKEPRGQFASDRACNKFVNCWDDVVVEQECGSGLLFNEERRYCDYPQNVECGGRIIEKPTISDSNCPATNGAFRSSTNCGVFFVCSNGIANKFECPGGLAYNDDLGVCDYPYRVDCKGIPLPPPPEEENENGLENENGEQMGSGMNPQQPAVGNNEQLTGQTESNPSNQDLTPQANLLRQGARCNHNLIYRLNHHCTSVSMCLNRRTEIINCAPGLRWDSYIGRCLPYNQARCL